MKKIITLLLATILLTSTKAQLIEWKSIPHNRSSSNFISLDASNELLQARNGSENNSVAKYTLDGDLKWENSICDCNLDWVTHSESVALDRILHLSYEGKLYLSNSLGDSSVVINQIIPDSLSDARFRFWTAELADNKIMTVAKGRMNGISTLIRATIDLSTFEITRNFIEFEPRVTSFSFNTDNRISVEIYASNDNSKIEKIAVYNNLLEEILSVQPVSPLEYFYDGYVTASNRLVIVGAKEKMNESYGLVRAYDLDGNLLWEFEKAPEEGEGILVFQKIEQNFNKLIIGGTIGEHLFSRDAVIYSIDEETGQIIWKLREHIQGEGDDVSDIMIISNEEIIISGTSGLTDFGGPQRAYLMKIRDSLPLSTNIINNEFYIYPNPSNSRISVKAETQVLKLEILSLDGQIVKESVATDTIDISTFAKGTYLLRIYTIENSIIKRIIVN